MTKLKIGLALGSGAARGWAHIGVLKALYKHNIFPDVIAGASMGSLVGAAAASNQLDTLEKWVRNLQRLDVLRLLDASFRGGVITGSRVMDAIGEQLEDQLIESMKIKFAAVATELDSGREVWFRDGSMLTAVRASCGLPGLFAPVKHEGRWLIDGGVVNPVPVSLCLALGADIVIAVNLNASLVNRRAQSSLQQSSAKMSAEERDAESSALEKVTRMVGSWMTLSKEKRQSQPGILDVVGASLNIMQERITRSRMAGEPPLLELRPLLPDIELMDFHRADEIIKAGEQSVKSEDERIREIARQIEISS